MNIALKKNIENSDKTIIAGTILKILFLKNNLEVSIKLFLVSYIFNKDWEIT